MAANPFDRPAPLDMFAELRGPRRPEGTEFDDITDPEGEAPGDDEFDYHSRVRGMIDDAREFNAEVLAPLREKGIMFYLGILPELDEEGRSTIVKTEVRDTILQMMPGLLRLFTSQDPPTTFIPNSKKTAAWAEQAQEYIHYVFNYDNPGYMLLQDVIKDSLIKGMGVATWWTDQNMEATVDEYRNLTLEQRQYVISQPGVEVMAEEPSQGQGPNGEIIPRFKLIVRRTKRTPQHRVASVPPDEFRINRTATCVKDAALVGREWFETQSNLLRKGVPKDLIATNKDFSGGDLRFAAERMFRNQGADSPFGRDSSEPVCRYGEYWMRIDKDGDGIAELRRICVIGDEQTIVLDEPASRAKMAIACVDPEPHSIVGHSFAELICDLQIIGTNIMRSSLDSLAQSIYPRLWGVDTQVDWDDVLNTAIGAPIRVKDPNALGQLAYTFIGQPAFDMMDRLDRIRMARTGITEQSKGLDPKALQSTTAQGVDMVVQGAQERIELVARTMAWTFMVDLFSGLLQEVTDNPVPERVIKLRGEYVEINPDQFDATMNCVPATALGKGSNAEKWAVLNLVLAKQEAIAQVMGAGNPLVTPMHYRNALEDICKLGHFQNSERYFAAVDEQTLAAYMQQLAQKEDPNMVLAKAEADKVRAQIVEILANARVKTEDMTLKDDRERDKNEGDQMLKAADIDAKYGAAVDTAAIQALWKEPRVAGQGPPSGDGEPGAPPQGPAPGAGPPMPGAGPKPELPVRTALGHGPPQLKPGGPFGAPPPGLLSPQGPGAGS